MIARFKSLLVVAATMFSAAAAPGQFSVEPLGPGDEKVRVSVNQSAESVAPGAEVAIVVVLDQEFGWHVHTNDPPELPLFVPIATELADLEISGAEVGPIQWPPSHEIEVSFTGSPIDYPVFEGRAPIFVPLRIAEDAVGEVRVSFTLVFQACDDRMCLPPEEVPFEVVFTVEAGTTSPVWPAAFADMDRTVFERSWTGASDTPGPADRADPGGSSFFGYVVPRGLLALAFFGFLGGLVLNLTPCVLPVIPLKVMALSKHSASKGRTLALGLAMALGVFGFWFAIGLPVAFLTSVTDPSQAFGIWWVPLGIGLIIAAMGVGIMGLFEIRLPDTVYRLNPKADTAWGSFLFGIMTAILGLPCFGFVVGALLPAVSTLPSSDILTVFGAIGVGMASPYLVLAAKPEWLAFIPRTGPASELVKQMMGLLMLAAAVYFIGSGVMALLKADPVRAAQLPVWVKVSQWWAVAFFVVAAGGWLAWRTFRITKRTARRVSFGVLGLGLGGVAVLFAVGQTDKAMHDIWTPYTGAVLEGARAEGRVVVVDFTADWCLNCQALKATVLDRDPVADRLASGGVVPLLADLTSSKAPGWAKLRDLGQTGIPLLVIYGPGLEEPWMSNGYTPGQVMDALDRAAGTAAARGSENGQGSPG